MTNLLQSATFPGITHKFLDLFASSKKKKNALLSCVDSTLFPLYIYIYIYKFTPVSFLQKKKKNYSCQVLLIFYQLTFPLQLIFFFFPFSSFKYSQHFAHILDIAMTFLTNDREKYHLTNQIVKKIPTCKR